MSVKHVIPNMFAHFMGKGGFHMLKYRRKNLFWLYLILFVCLAGRFFQLQLLAGPGLARTASAQRLSNADIEKMRGAIQDRNGISFTGRSRKVSVILQPLLLRGKEAEIRAMSEVLGLDPTEIQREIDIRKAPIILQIDEDRKKSIEAFNLEGISFVNSLMRYDDSTLARHVLGYLNKTDQTGEAGLEKAYQDVLRMGKDDAVGVITDARNNLLQGLGYRMIRPKEQQGRLNLQLTLDFHIQRIVEDVMNEKRMTGAVVVEEVATGNILAMASKPDFDSNDIGSFLSSDRKELYNRSVASYNLGSIFKIIDTALLYEEAIEPDSSFFCPGYIKIGNKQFKCSSYEKGGHGSLGLEGAFARSCNPYFIDMGIHLGYKNILEMAKKFGLGENIGAKEQGVDESPGLLPDTNRYFSDGDTANISIGQGEVLATPLQVADLVATVANGGIKNRIHIVDAIVGPEGNRIRDLKRSEGHRILSRETADKLKELMEEVTNTGTGIKANLETLGGAGGKTSSAETGQLIHGEKVIHAWFAGYFPASDPRYAVSVFWENGKNGGQEAAPVFSEIAQRILKKGF
jgi:penicillin-binding protein 2